MFGIGIDAGSRAIKVAIYESESEQVIVTGLRDQGVDQEALAWSLLEEVLERGELPSDHGGKVVATGYGRNLLGFADTTITEITCHARGVRFACPEARTVVEVGGQDSKLIRLDLQGAVRDFAMNDRCAAGTGRFLEMVAARIESPLEALGGLVEASTEPAAISSMCVVFAETEIVGLLAAGVPASNIVVGVQQAISKRVVAMAGRNVEDPVCFTGGVALVPGMADALQAAMGRQVVVVAQPQMTGAIGAAILASHH